MNDKLPQREIFRSPRVGLHMTKSGVAPELQQNFVFKFYRYFTEPKRVIKGKHLMVAALHHLGKTPTEIGTLIGSKADTIGTFIKAYDKGKEGDASKFVGKKLTTDAEICSAVGSLHKFLPTKG